MAAFVEGIDWAGSPHHSERRGRIPEAVIFHYTAGPTSGSSIRWFQMNASLASAHFIIARNGRITQMVDLSLAAWHAGAAEMLDGDGEMHGDVNRRTIGVEFSNLGLLVKTKGGLFYQVGRDLRRYKGDDVVEAVLTYHNGYRIQGWWQTYTAEQIDAANWLLDELGKTVGYEAAVNELWGHEEIGMPFGRKSDPGPLLPWSAFLHRRDLSTRRTGGRMISSGARV